MFRGFFALSLIGMTLSACGSGLGSDEDSLASEMASQYAIPQRSNELTRVTDIYGPLVVREGFHEMQADKILWSASYLPINQKYLFEKEGGGWAPLQKYDEYVKKVHGRQPSAAEYERDVIYRPFASPWEGACDALALASVLEKVPGPRVLHGIEFTVEDLKALLIKTYEVTNWSKDYAYGQRFGAMPGVDYSDMYPDQFLRFAQVQLIEKRRAFTIDRDPGPEVWNYPVTGVDVRLERDPVNPYIMHGEAWAEVGLPLFDVYETSYPKIGHIGYTFDLYGAPRSDGSFHVDFGLWTGESEGQNHPDFAMEIPEQLVRGSKNKNLRVEFVDEIVWGARRN